MEILIIEDNAIIKEDIEEILTFEKYKVITADYGLTVINMAKRFMPDLIICDIIMDGLDGYEVFNQLNNNPKNRSIPFYILDIKI